MLSSYWSAAGDDEEPPAHHLHQEEMCQGQGGAECQPAHQAQVGDVHPEGAGHPRPPGNAVISLVNQFVVCSLIGQFKLMLSSYWSINVYSVL